jgi:hypothetical protein
MYLTNIDTVPAGAFGGAMVVSMLVSIALVLYLRAAGDYVVTDHAVTFAPVVEAARRRSELAFGYRVRADANDATKGDGVVVNPPKSKPITFHSTGRILPCSISSLAFMHS